MGIVLGDLDISVHIFEMYILYVLIGVVHFVGKIGRHISWFVQAAVGRQMDAAETNPRHQISKRLSRAEEKVAKTICRLGGGGGSYDIFSGNKEV